MPKSTHPRDTIWQAMRAKGLTVRGLAAAMTGDYRSNKAMLGLLFHENPTWGPPRLGAVLAHRIAKPLGLNANRLLDAEREWFQEHRARPRPVPKWVAPDMPPDDL